MLVKLRIHRRKSSADASHECPLAPPANQLRMAGVYADAPLKANSWLCLPSCLASSWPRSSLTMHARFTLAASRAAASDAAVAGAVGL